MAVWLHTVKKKFTEKLAIRWKCFSLEQLHSERGTDFKLWEHPDVATRSLLALKAAKCAEQQGDHLFDAFHLLLFEAFHRERKDTNSEEVLKTLAQKANLDIQRFMQDLRSDASWKLVGQDHEEAVERYRVFGVPALAFDQQGALFLKLGSLPDADEEKVNLFNDIKALTQRYPSLQEIKRT